jgi:argininosuccinate lyase
MSHDIEASSAHAAMLKDIGVLTEAEYSDILVCLSILLKKLQKEKIEITEADEDCHTVIENFLVEKLDDTGKKIHTGRSRNDQVLVALRLYMKENLKKMQSSALALAQDFLVKAKEYQNVPLPGYSHTQQAMLSSVGHYYCSFLEALLGDITYIQSVLQQIDCCPLGSAAGFGVSLPLDRKQVADRLGFSTVQLNSLYCQNSRGKFESMYLEACVQIMMTLGKFASDILLFTSQEFDFFTVDESLVTGSSIMPQKKNLDGLEILRGNVCLVTANQHLIQDIAKNLISGYHRDLQLIKKPLIESTQITLQSIEVAGLYLNGITPKQDVIESKITKDISMADKANYLVQEQGIPFRDAYKMAAKESDDATVDFAANIASKVSPGAPGNLFLDHYEERIHELSL